MRITRETAMECCARLDRMTPEAALHDCDLTIESIRPYRDSGTEKVRAALLIVERAENRADVIASLRRIAEGVPHVS